MKTQPSFVARRKGTLLRRLCIASMAIATALAFIGPARGQSQQAFQVFTLTNRFPAAADSFGFSVAVVGSTFIIVGLRLTTRVPTIPGQFMFTRGIRRPIFSQTTVSSPSSGFTGGSAIRWRRSLTVSWLAANSPGGNAAGCSL
jgi:hypothetical protein